MGKYTSSARQAQKPKRDSMPPLVRGIGCLLFVLVPIFAFLVSIFLTENGGPLRSLPFPPSWFDAPRLPDLLLQLSGIRNAWNFLQAQTSIISHLTTANIIFTILITVVVYSLMSVIYGYIFNMVGPSRYGPTDVPPPRVKTKKFKR